MMRRGEQARRLSEAVNSLFLLDRLSPPCGLLGRQLPGRRLSDVLVAPAFDVNQILTSREQRALAQPLRGRRMIVVSGEPVGQFLQDCLRNARPLAGIDKPEQNQVAE